MSLRKLPIEVQSLMCASSHINSFKKAVEELVYNALDADSTSIAIRVHISDGALHVIDNGRGIQKSDYNLLGQRYTTSRYLENNLSNKYGMLGVSLANIIEVSKQVKITSKHEKEEDALVKEIYKNKEKPYEVTKRPSKGTTVQIKGFLYNKNIVRKSLNSLKALQDIKTFLEKLCLIHTNISLSLRDEDKNEIVFQIPKNRDIYKTIDMLFGIKSCDTQELKIEKNDYKVTGFIEKRVLEIDIQWIFLNNKTVSRRNKVYKVLKEYLKPKRPDKGDLKSNLKWQKLNDDFLLKNKSPFYIIFIQCPSADYTTVNTYFEFKNWELIKKLLKKFVQFYYGDIEIKEVQINQRNETKIMPQTTIQDQVKQIMEKFLGTKKLGTSQLQNGVTGKLINRKSKKRSKTSHKSNKKINKLEILINTQQNMEGKTKYDVKNDPDTKLNKSIENNKRTENNSPRKSENNVIRRKGNICRIKDKIGKKQKKKTKLNRKYTNKKTKVKIHNDSLMQRFVEPTDSIRQRCNSISRKAKEVLNHIRPKHVFVKENIVHTNTFEGNKQISVRKRVNEIIIHDYVPLPPKVHRENVENPFVKPMDKCLSTYDLLSTILLSQCGPKEKRKDAVQYKPTEKQVKEITENITSPLTSKLTFQSHCYNLNYRIQSNHNGVLLSDVQNKKRFISVPSKNNFEVYPNKNLFDSYKPNIEKPLVSPKNQHKPKNISDCNISVYHTYSHRESGFESSQTPQCQDLNKTLPSFPITVQEIQSSYFENVRKTYSIFSQTSEKSFYHCLNKEENSEEGIIEAQSLCHKTVEDSSQDKVIKSNGNKLPNNVNLSDLNPLDICETIMNSNEKDEVILFSTLSDSNVISEINNGNQTAHKQDKGTETVSHYSGSIEYPDININFIQNVNSRLRSSYFDNHIFDMEQSDKINKYEYGATENQFDIKSRFQFVPKGMSQIFMNCKSKIDCSYNFEKDYFTNNLYDEFVNKVAVNSELFDPTIQKVKDNTSKGIEKLINKVNSENASLKFDALAIKNARVLGQVDDKFIAAIVFGKNHNRIGATESLVLFDQHAVDERIRLERNMTDYKEKEQWKKVQVDNVPLTLNKDEILYLHNYKDKFSQFGLEWDIMSNNQIVLKSVPKSVLGKISRPLDKVTVAIKKLIMEQIKAMKLQSGCVSLYPKSIMDLVFSEACRYAIKFGDKLTAQQCEDMLNSLSECKMPFQCAHGRPVMAVLIDVTKNNYEYKVNMNKLKQFKFRTYC